MAATGLHPLIQLCPSGYASKPFDILSFDLSGAVRISGQIDRSLTRQFFILGI